MFMLLFVLALCFFSEITLFAIFDKEISLVSRATNTKQAYTVSVFFKTSNNSVPASNNKTSPFL